MTQPSALKLAHDEILVRLRLCVDVALGQLQDDVTVPIGIPRALMDALRECDRMEGAGRDWAQMEESLTAMVHEANAEAEERVA